MARGALQMRPHLGSAVFFFRGSVLHNLVLQSYGSIGRVRALEEVFITGRGIHRSSAQRLYAGCLHSASVRRQRQADLSTSQSFGGVFLALFF